MKLKNIASIDQDKTAELFLWLRKMMKQEDIYYIYYKRIYNLLKELKDYDLIK